MVDSNCSWLKYLVPRIALLDWPTLLVSTLIGSVIAGLYGVLHDQLTFTISPEYFRKFKFNQFAHADLGLGDRIFVSTIGILATWWLGAIAGWFLARRALSNRSGGSAYRQIRSGILVMLTVVFLSGCLGYLWGIGRGLTADDSAWDAALNEIQIQDKKAFIRVAFIHNFGYLGGLVGLLFALVRHPKQQTAIHVAPPTTESELN